MKLKFIILFFLFPVCLMAQQAKTAFENLNKILSYDDSLVSLSMSFPKIQGKNYRLNYLKELTYHNQLKMPSNIKNQEVYADGYLASAEGLGDREEFEIFMAQKYSKGPFNLHIGNEKFLIEANLEEGTISSIDYINPKNRNLLRFIYHGETHQIVQCIYQLEVKNEKNKNEELVLYFNELKQSGAIDRNSIQLNKDEIANLARQFYLITEQLIFRYKAIETDYSYATFEKEKVILKVDSFLQTFNQSLAKDTYGNPYSSYFTGEKEVKIYTIVIVTPTQEKSVLFEFHGMPFAGTQFNQNKINDGIRKIILEELKYKIGSYACFPSGAELRSLFVISKGRIVELKN